jgi:hypothetical protein
MDAHAAGPNKPKFRDGVSAVVAGETAHLARGADACSFDFPREAANDVSRLFDDLRSGGWGRADLAARAPQLAREVPQLLHQFDELRFLVESDPARTGRAVSGAQLYRDVRRVADAVVARVAHSHFQRALLEHTATRRQLVGYALEYYWIVREAPGLIGPALGSAHTPVQRKLLQDFLKSELGHERFLATSLRVAGLTESEYDAHQPLPATFALGASLGVYARQHPLSFKAALFLFERAQPDFIDAFDERCRALGLPDAFHAPLRAHANLNDEYDHEDISRALLEPEGAVDAETVTVVKRHVAILAETLVLQEEQILDWYGDDANPSPRIFD